MANMHSGLNNLDISFRCDRGFAQAFMILNRALPSVHGMSMTLNEEEDLVRTPSFRLSFTHRKFVFLNALSPNLCHASCEIALQKMAAGGGDIMQITFSAEPTDIKQIAGIRELANRLAKQVQVDP